MRGKVKRLTSEIKFKISLKLSYFKFKKGDNGL